MKKITDDQGNDNGPFSSNKKASSKSVQPSADHLQKEKFELGNTNPGANKRRVSEDNDLIKRTTLKHGSRRNLL